MTFDPSIIILCIILLTIVFSFWQAHRNPAVQFNAYDLVLENGKVSKLSVVLMGSFLITTWMVIHLTLNGKISEGYFTIYGGMWIAPLLTRILKGDGTPQASEK